MGSQSAIAERYWSEHKSPSRAQIAFQMLVLCLLLIRVLLDLTFKDAVIATVAKQERVRISLRVRAGLEVARTKGKRIGRPPRTELSLETRAAIAGCYANEKTSLRALAKRFGTSLGTVQRCIGMHHSAAFEGDYPLNS